ncbi:MAG: type I-E CRISPR-associated protein Cse1/CasA [Acidimicrobiales bacterium]
MGDERFGFNLTSEPWLPVRFADGTTAEVNLVEALTRAHDIVGLDIEFPTQEPALLRLLLACCYRVLEGPTDDAAWHELWSVPTLPSPPIDSYFARWRARFDLFGDRAPFFQSPGLEPSGTGGVKVASKLISFAPSGNNVPVFTPMTDAMALKLRPAEAARWLVERHAWGTTADKTGAKGNPKLKAGKDTPQVGHLGWIGFVAPIGSTLRETLLLNLVPWSRTGLIGGGPDDLPAWERPPLGPTREMRPPVGVCDLFTWQGRRIRLYPERRGDKVVVGRVLICAGDDVDREAVRTVDPHTGWRTTKEKDGSLVFAPLRARPGQQVWRGLSALLALEEDRDRAGVLSWLAAVESEGVQRVSLLVTSAEFGPMSTTLVDLVSDRLDTPLVVLRTEDLAAATVASDAVSLVNAAAKALGRVADGPFLKADGEKVRVPEGKTAQAAGARSAIAEDLYAALDAPFRRFLMDLVVADRQIARESWAQTVTAVAKDVADKNMAQFSAAQAFTAAMAEAQFRRALARATAEFNPGTDNEEGVV